MTATHPISIRNLSGALTQEGRFDDSDVPATLRRHGPVKQDRCSGDKTETARDQSKSKDEAKALELAYPKLKGTGNAVILSGAGTDSSTAREDIDMLLVTGLDMQVAAPGRSL